MNRDGEKVCHRESVVVWITATKCEKYEMGFFPLYAVVLSWFVLF